MEVRHLGGALARADGRAVVGRRDGEFVLYTGSALADPGRREPAAAAQARLHEALAPWGIGAVTPAFLAGPHVTRADLRSAFAPRDRARLRDVKRSMGPGGHVPGGPGGNGGRPGRRVSPHTPAARPLPKGPGRRDGPTG